MRATFRNALFLGAILVVWMGLGTSIAQTITGTAALAAPLDNLAGSARDLGLGSAFVGVADDASALFFNPAGLSGLHNPEVALHHNSYLAGTFQETLAAAFPAASAGGLAFALDYVGWGSLDLRDSLGVSQGSYSDTDIGFTAGWGIECLPRFSIGIAARGLQQKVVNDLYTSLAADLGMLWSPVKDLRIGLAYLNLGTPVAGSNLNGELKGGASYDLESGGFDLLMALSASWSPGGVASMQAGLEGFVDRQWALRVGYQVPFYDDQTDGFRDLTAGVGVKISPFSLDYAFIPFGTLGTSHRLSLAYQFELPKEVVKVPVQVPVTVVQPAPAPPKPKDVEVHFKIENDPLAEPRALEKEGKLKEAVAATVAVLKQDPRNDRAWSTLGNLYYKLGQKTYAIQCFEQVLKLEPGNEALRTWLKKYKEVSSP
jgi:hypothetical protein